VDDEACVAFLKWCLPRLGLRWSGYRKVRGVVRKRLARRLAELGSADLAGYRAILDREPGEWARLDAMCRIPISRFHRDRAVFAAIGRELLPAAAAAAAEGGGATVRCWSAGCASGEEPYTLALLWRLDVALAWPDVDLRLIATDADETMLARAEAACYGRSSLRELPQRWLERAFVRAGPLLRLRREYREAVQFAQQDIRAVMPDGPFDLILCRNLAFTYFDELLQHRILRQLRERLRPGGSLVLGMHEGPPSEPGRPTGARKGLPIFRREALDGG
jgi:chemotaxis protein methyltransferase CheR